MERSGPLFTFFVFMIGFGMGGGGPMSRSVVLGGVQPRYAPPNLHVGLPCRTCP
jgi:hypothetical protein